MKKTILSRVGAAAVLAIGLASAPAMATANDDTFVFRVNASALETPSDVSAAYERLTSEAQRYCQALGLSVDRDLAVCRLDVVANVVEAVGEERLNTLHRATVNELRLASVN